jgi:membrane protein DedA with SNARE-associated domain
MGWPGVVALMALETIVFLIPSEAVMTFAGWLLVKEEGLGPEWIVLAALLGGLGSTIGGWAFYYAGAWGGRPFLERYGRYFFISEGDIAKSERFFDRWGPLAVFFGRMVPLVRSFVSIPAGIAGMDIRAFTLYTFAGSTIWAGLLATAGYMLGENWEDLRAWMGPADIIVALVLALLAAWYIWHQVKESWEGPRTSKPEA